MAGRDSLCTGYDKSCCKTAAYYHIKLEGWHFNRLASKHWEIIKIFVSVAFRGRMADVYGNLF